MKSPIPPEFGNLVNLQYLYAIARLICVFIFFSALGLRHSTCIDLDLSEVSSALSVVCVLSLFSSVLRPVSLVAGICTLVPFGEGFHDRGRI